MSHAEELRFRAGIIKSQRTEIERLREIIGGALAHSYGPYSNAEHLRRVVVILNKAGMAFDWPPEREAAEAAETGARRHGDGRY